MTNPTASSEPPAIIQSRSYPSALKPYHAPKLGSDPVLGPSYLNNTITMFLDSPNQQQCPNQEEKHHWASARPHPSPSPSPSLFRLHLGPPPAKAHQDPLASSHTSRTWSTHDASTSCTPASTLDSACRISSSAVFPVSQTPPPKKAFSFSSSPPSGDWKVQYDGGSTGIADLPLASPVIRDRESHGSRRVRWSGSAVREIKMGSAGLVGDPKDAAVAVDAVAGSDSDADTEASGARGGTSGAVAGVVSADVEDASCLHDGLSPQVTARRCNAGLRLGAWDEMGDVGVDCVTTDERVSAYGSTRLGVMSILVFLLSGLGVAIQEHRLGGLGWDRNLESDSGSRVERVTEAWGGQVKPSSSSGAGAEHSS
ncbi:hypothetical protein MBM_02040 [Drepanopeziza brunnea f. sp. 'multigermtubi' MB_m1]|uniref:Uncharacterized protein n=1 Tax=Marssonina brunnea f. sp. multigermtubi (strain MB_m1) TaxID=1072389 RepID=K1XH45_MARBU|nr:uncharacterized protein MBM_02040 [Drepanopeziza brunnea f. sp. 'multigermtubi' MB_m1]EKD20088.1 hypothetical protein MBM_02040 [Drepanopeziza brunnea f. sp. 'multigermtubi' MB_m1]